MIPDDYPKNSNDSDGEASDLFGLMNGEEGDIEVAGNVYAAENAVSGLGGNIENSEEVPKMPDVAKRVLNDYISVINTNIKSITVSSPGVFLTDNENITAATAIPFGTFSVIKIFSFKLKLVSFNAIVIANHLATIIIMNNKTVFKIYIGVKLILTRNPTKTNTSISNAFENIELNSCNENFLLT